MKITVKSSNKVWSSPDGQISIYDITDQDGNKWQTRSNKIAEAIDQVLDLTTTVSKSGKTYLVQVPREGSEWSRPSYATQPHQTAPETAPEAPRHAESANMSVPTVSQIERLENVLERFERAVEKLFPSRTKDTLPTDEEVDRYGDVNRAAELLGGEVTDDL